MNIDSIYGFNVFLTDQPKLQPLYKVGNNDSFNKLFESTASAKVLHLDFIDALEQYAMYYFSVSNFEMILDTTALLHPYGKGKVKNSNDCILFKMENDFKFEVYVSNGNLGLRSQIFQMLKDGKLDSEIANLKSKLKGF